MKWSFGWFVTSREQAELADLRAWLNGERDADAESFVAPDPASIKKTLLARRKEELLQQLAKSTEAGGAAPLVAEEGPKRVELKNLPRLPPSW